MTTPTSTRSQASPSSLDSIDSIDLKAEFQKLTGELRKAGKSLSLYLALTPFFGWIGKQYTLNDDDRSDKGELTIPILLEYLKAKQICSLNFKKFARTLNGLNLTLFEEQQKQWASLLLSLLKSGEAEGFLEVLTPAKKKILDTTLAEEMFSELTDGPAVLYNKISDLGEKIKPYYIGLLREKVIGQARKLDSYSLAFCMAKFLLYERGKDALKPLIEAFKADLEEVSGADQRATLLTQAKASGAEAGSSAAYWLAAAICNAVVTKKTKHLPGLLKLFESSLKGLDADQRTALLTQARTSGANAGSSAANRLACTICKAVSTKNTTQLFVDLSFSMLNCFISEDAKVSRNLKYLFSQLTKITPDAIPLFILIDSVVNLDKNINNLLATGTIFRVFYSRSTSLDMVVRKLVCRLENHSKEASFKMPDTLKLFLEEINNIPDSDSQYFNKLYALLRSPDEYKLNLNNIAINSAIGREPLKLLKASLKALIMGYSKKYQLQNTPLATNKWLALMAATLDRQHWIGAILRHHRGRFFHSPLATNTVQDLIRFSIKPYFEVNKDDIEWRETKAGLTFQSITDILKKSDWGDNEVGLLSSLLKKGLGPKSTAPDESEEVPGKISILPNAPSEETDWVVVDLSQPAKPPALSIVTRLLSLLQQNQQDS